MDDGLAELVRKGRALRPMFGAVQARVQHAVPDDVQEWIDAIGQDFRFESPPARLRHLTLEGGSRRDWLRPFQNALAGDVPAGLRACHYHLDAIQMLEREIVEACLANLPQDRGPKSEIVSGMNIGKLSYEYQAFQFAVRRTLEYLAVAIAAYFKSKPKSFARLARAVTDKEPADVRDRVLAAVASAQEELSDLLEGTTIRDRMAHWEAVDAGVLNIWWHGEQIKIGLVGGGEGLGHPFADLQREQTGPVVSMRLGPMLAARLGQVEAVVFRVAGALGLSNPA